MWICWDCWCWLVCWCCVGCLLGWRSCWLGCWWSRMSVFVGCCCRFWVWCYWVWWWWSLIWCGCCVVICVVCRYWRCVWCVCWCCVNGSSCSIVFWLYVCFCCSMYVGWLCLCCCDRFLFVDGCWGCCRFCWLMFGICVCWFGVLVWDSGLCWVCLLLLCGLDWFGRWVGRLCMWDFRFYLFVVVVGWVICCFLWIWIGWMFLGWWCWVCVLLVGCWCRWWMCFLWWVVCRCSCWENLCYLLLVCVGWCVCWLWFCYLLFFFLLSIFRNYMLMYLMVLCICFILLYGYCFGGCWFVCVDVDEVLW